MDHILPVLALLLSMGLAAAQGAESAAPARKPNILWIMCDQLRYDCVGANGNSIIRTPNLDKLASGAANFSSFYVQSPVCVPSRASYFTGRYPHSHKNRVNYTPLSESEILLPARLQQAGYKTALVGKTHLYYHYPPTAEEAGKTGFDLVDLHDAVPFVDKWSAYVAWRKEHDPNHDINYRRLMRDVPRLRDQLPPGSNPYRSAIDERYSETTWTGLRTRDRIKEMSAGDKPFFIFCSFWKPHGPYEVPSPFDSMYSQAEIPLPPAETLQSIQQLPPPAQKLILRGRKPEYLTDRADLEWMYRSYYGTVSHIDREIGLILDELTSSDVAKNTIIVFNADHGDQLLEHGLFGKNVFFESSVHVPLFMAFPGRIAGGRYDVPVESVDVMPTLMELAQIPEPLNVQGRSMTALIDGSHRPYTPREAVFAENVIPEVITGNNPEMLFEFEKGKGVRGIRHPDAKMVRTKKWKYNYYPDGYAELYDEENDIHEQRNLADDPAHKPIVEEMKTRLLQWLITADETDQIAPRWLMH